VSKALKTRRLGLAGLEISVLGLGSWAFGGPDWAFGWGTQGDADSHAAISRAVSLGINWIDTAPAYGLGHAEEVIGRALRHLPGSERPFVFTKCGVVWSGRKIRHHLGSDSIRREVEQSLTRLGLEAIDLYQIHWPDFPPGGPAPDIEEAWSALSNLRAEGKVRHIGVSNFDVGQLERIRPVGPVESLQPPYSILHREIEADILPYCRRHGIGVIAYSPLASGLLSGTMTRERLRALPSNDWRKTKGEEFQEPRLSRNLAMVERLRRIGDRRGVTPALVAVAWTLRHPAVTGAIVGARSARQVDQIAAAAALDLTEQELAQIDELRR
jgi:aryl-alcohol dehydrogenase-like predicted oxidoreductase